MNSLNPVIFNFVLLYLTVVLLSLLQSRFKIAKDDPVTFCLLLFVFPFLMFGKAAKLKSWTAITGFEIAGWTLMLAYLNPKRIVPKVNEGYIYSYTLFHWYLLIEASFLKGVNIWAVLIYFISVYPTLLIVKAVLEHKRLTYRSKLILYYWFLFAIMFTYIDQVALQIIHPLIAINEISFASSAYVLITAIQLYFIATSLSLIFVGIPVFHLDRSKTKFKIRWQRAMREWRKTVRHKLGNFIEYQISLPQFVYITVVSLGLFYLDFSYNFRLYLIFFYTVIFPLVFFYMKYTPGENLDDQPESSNHIGL